MIAAGTYTARAKGFDFGVTQNDKDYVAVDFEITGPQHVGETIGWRGYFSTEGAVKRTLESLKFAGWSGQQDTLESLPGLGNCEVELVINHETYEGKTHARVQWVNNLGRGGVALGEQMDPNRKRAFAARMRGHIAALNAAPGAAPSPAPKPRAPAAPAASPSTSSAQADIDDNPF